MPPLSKTHRILDKDIVKSARKNNVVDLQRQLNCIKTIQQIEENYRTTTKSDALAIPNLHSDDIMQNNAIHLCNIAQEGVKQTVTLPVISRKSMSRQTTIEETFL